MVGCYGDSERRCRPIVQDALESKVGSLSVRSAGLPGSGAVLCLILNILDGDDVIKRDFVCNFCLQDII